MYGLTEYKIYVDGKYHSTVKESSHIGEDLVRVKYITKYGFRTIVIAQLLHHKREVAWNVSR